MNERKNERKAEHPVDPIFIDRWSPRSFTGEEIPGDILMSCFEAARWSPSSSNSQPWRFLYAKNIPSNTEQQKGWDRFFNLLVEGNQVWAKKASALILLVSRKTVVWDGQVVPSGSYSLDAGAAWQNFALQASKLGWPVHGMAGFDKEKARTEFKIPDDFSIEMMIAIGKQNPDKSSLPAYLQERELANNRIPVSEFTNSISARTFFSF